MVASAPSTSPTAPRTVVLVHGAWHGAWCWWKVVDGLQAAGVPVVAVELPLAAGVDADAEAVRAVIDATTGPTVVVGHSYGGLVISRAVLGAANVDHAVYLTAMMVDEGESATEIMAAHPTGLGGAQYKSDTGRQVSDETLVEVFYADCSEADVSLARMSLRPMPLRAPAPAKVGPGWKDVAATTYVVCTEDRALHPDAQRVMARHAQRVVSWDTGHSPFFSRPELVVGLLGGLAFG